MIMPRRSLWRSPYAQLRGFTDNVKQNRQLFSVKAFRLALSVSNVLDLLEEELYDTEEALEKLKRIANDAEMKLRYELEYQPFDDNEGGQMQKKICDLYGAYEQLEYVRRFTFMGVAEVFGPMIDGGMKSFNTLLLDAKTLLSGLREEERLLCGSVKAYEGCKYSMAFDKAAGRLGVEVKNLLSNIRKLEELEQPVYD